MERGSTDRLATDGEGIRPDALEYWRQQELAPLPLHDAPREPDAEDGPDAVAGWWILPALLVSVPVWYGLIRLLF